jgi:SynChlorMet cassette radical SAM/SPASM protein ScmE
MDLLITARCNLRCTYCSHFTSGSDVQRDLPTEVWLKFFEELRQCAVMDVCFQGGEPFIREDFKDLIRGVVKNRMRFSVLTNGTLITDELASFLAGTGRCNSIQVSIDGATARTHDVCRGKGNFSRAVEGLKLLLKHDVPATVRVTIHRGNVHDIDKIATLLLEHFGLPGFSTNSAAYLGLCRRNTEEILLTHQERSLAMRTLAELVKTYDGRISASAGPLAEARGWMAMERARVEGREAQPGQGFLTGCGGPMERIGVRADGVMVPCVQIPDMALGRINTDGLQEIWQHHPDLNRFRNRRRIPLSEFEFCKECPYMPYCTGNCPASSYAIVHNAYHPSPEGCLRRFLHAGGQLPVALL